MGAKMCYVREVASNPLRIEHIPPRPEAIGMVDHSGFDDTIESYAHLRSALCVAAHNNKRSNAQ